METITKKPRKNPIVFHFPGPVPDKKRVVGRLKGSMARCDGRLRGGRCSAGPILDELYKELSDIVRTSADVPRGGITVAYHPATKVLAASVCVRKDLYRRQLGAKIAIGRASKASVQPFGELIVDDSSYEAIKQQAVRMAKQLAKQHGVRIA